MSITFWILLSLRPFRMLGLHTMLEETHKLESEAMPLITDVPMVVTMRKIRFMIYFISNSVLKVLIFHGSFSFETELRGMHRFPCNLCPFRCITFPIINSSHQNVALFTEDEPPMTRRKPSKPPVDFGSPS